MNKFDHEKEYDTMCESVKKLIADTETKMFELIENYNNNVEFENPSETFA